MQFEPKVLTRLPGGSILCNLSRRRYCSIQFGWLQSALRLVSGAGDLSGIAVDETRNLIYAMGYSSSTITSNYLQVFDISTGNLLADLPSDPLDVHGFASNPANGSAAVEMVENASGTYIYALSENNGCARYSYSTVLTVASSGGDFTTIRSAIDSYCKGAANAGAVKPLVISIDPAGGPYDEAISLDQIDSGTGDIAGDLVLKSIGSGKAIIQFQEGNVPGDDGLPIHQDVASVIFKNLVLCPSPNNPFNDDLLDILENSDNSIENWVEFYGCIITEIDDGGNPMITSAANALDEPGTYGSDRQDGDTLFRFGTTGTHHSRSLFMDQSVIYGSQHLNYMYMGGTTNSQIRLHNTIISQSRVAGIFCKNEDSTHQLIITGDDQTEGILTGDTINCSAIYEFNRRLFYDYAAGIHTRNTEAKLILVVKNAIIRTTQDNAQSRGISSWPTNDKPPSPLGHFTNLYKIHDVLIDVPGFGIADDISNDPDTPLDLRRVTIISPERGIFLTDDCTNTVNITDCIFADCSMAAVQKSTTPTTNVVMNNCGLPNTGTHAIAAAATGEVNLTNNSPVTADPRFRSINVLSANYLDVAAGQYRGAASDGADLVGGADYVGDIPTGIETEGWEYYR